MKLDNRDVRIKDALTATNMNEYMDQDVYDLSLGQKQRINIAAVLAIKPKYILMDEPTAMIDSIEKDNIYNIIKKLKKDGYSVIFTTNNVNEILLSDRIVILEGKGIKHIIKKDELLENVDLLNSSNIKTPDILEMFLKLRENGININLKEWSFSELIDEVVKVLKK